jgi:5-methylcytosine-specific restriction endonuclease McrA
MRRIKGRLFRRQHGLCANPACGRKMTLMNQSLPNSAQLDHILARGKGGADEMSNYQLLCGGCNRRKHVKDRVRFEIEYAKKIGALGVRKA